MRPLSISEIKQQGAVKIEKWVPFVIFSYVAFVSFIIVIVNGGNYNVYDFTDEQLAALESPSNDPITLLNKLLILSNLSTVYGIVGAITLLWGILFIIAIAVAINEFVPFT